MENRMKELRAQSVNRKNSKQVCKIYYDAFAKKDRMPFWMMRAMAKMKHTKLLAFYYGNELVGFVYMAVVYPLNFVMFLAVDVELRSQGYGGGMLNYIQAMYPDHKIIISIERCDDLAAENRTERLRRKEFYLRNGFQETGFLVELGSETQEVIVKNGAFDGEEFVSFFRKYSNGTMRPKLWRQEKQGS